MTKKTMLIDASHPEETRVVVVEGSQLDDFDVEVASRRQIKGNIYLAKVTRVEPSLQAAFVDYGGNRHGFLAFNEIHPDYYQIPVADREALLAEQAAESAIEAAEESGDIGVVDDDDEIERRRPRTVPRYYKIQEVIKRRQIMLVQVVKEERGSKGAALTTYLSLAGRYCVLMPNSSRGGGISRKVTNPTDRRRLKKILAELDVAEGMAVIVRTAGAGRSKAEIKRDYDYLVRLWSSVREKTLSSMAPALVYEEGDLIKRSIRDLYGRDIEEIIIQGEAEYRSAKEFMKLFIPSHAKRVRLYDDPSIPLLHRYGIEAQLEAMHNMTIQLKSGGYIVINPTEALVAIDVNSGRATRERHIEETALRTNLEAADEIARQLRLRDLAGLIVIDFIDMENSRNQGLVERRLKEAMKSDKARVQIGRISPFGLLELSRQRLRPSLLETCFEVCSHCGGAGVRRTTESTALAILHQIEDEGISHRASEIAVSVPTAVALYLLNHKRRAISLIEDRYGLAVRIIGDDRLLGAEQRIERLKPGAPSVEDVGEEVSGPSRTPLAESEPTEEAEVEQEAADSIERDEVAKRSRRRRSRRRKRPAEGGTEATVVTVAGAAAHSLEAGNGADVEAGTASLEGETTAGNGTEDTAATADDEADRRLRRRGRRGGRRRAARRPVVSERGEAPATGTVDVSERPFAESPLDVSGVEEAVTPPTGESAPAADDATAAFAGREASPVGAFGTDADDVMRPRPASDGGTLMVEPRQGETPASMDPMVAETRPREPEPEPRTSLPQGGLDTTQIEAPEAQPASEREEDPTSSSDGRVEDERSSREGQLPDGPSSHGSGMDHQRATSDGDDHLAQAHLLSRRKDESVRDASEGDRPVHNVGAGVDDGFTSAEQRRRGWWQRLVE